MKDGTQDAKNWTITSGEKSAKGDAADGLTGLTVRTFTNMADVCRSFVDGLCRVAPLVVVYVMAMQFYESLRYVFF
jgi:hypothetical protein